MPKPKNTKKNYKIPTKRIIIRLAARIQSGETTAEQELGAGKQAWIYQKLRGKFSKEKNFHLKERVKKIFTPGMDDYHDFLLQVLDKMKNGQTEEQLLEEFDNAHKPTPSVPKAPAGDAAPSSSEEEEEQEETDMLVVTAHAETKKPASHPKYVPMLAFYDEAYVMFGNHTSGREGHKSWRFNSEIVAWLNMLVHVILTKDYVVKDTLLQEIASPTASQLFSELRRSRGVITREAYNLQAIYVDELRKTPEDKEKTAEEVDEQLRIDYPSSVILRSLHCVDGCDTYIESDQQHDLNKTHWTNLRKVNAEGQYYVTHFCPECGHDVRAQGSYLLPPQVLSINLPKFKENGTLLHEGGYGFFEDEFPKVANLRGMQYHRRYSIIYARGEHWLVLYDPPNGDEQEVITSRKPRCVSIKMTELQEPVSQSFEYAVRVVYKKAPGAPRMSDLKSYQQQGRKAAGGANAGGPSQPRRR